MIRVSDQELLSMLVDCKGNKSEAARRLDMQRRQLQRRLDAMRGKKEKHGGALLP